MARLSRLFCALLALSVVACMVATPADAKRVRLGGSSSSSSSEIEKVYELPRMPELTLPDGRPIDIGLIRGGSSGGKLVGYIGPGRQYLDLPADKLEILVNIAGFPNTGAFVSHILKRDEEAKNARKAEQAEKRQAASDGKAETVNVATSGSPISAEAASTHEKMILCAVLLILIGVGLYVWHYMKIAIAVVRSFLARKKTPEVEAVPAREARRSVPARPRIAVAASQSIAKPLAAAAPQPAQDFSSLIAAGQLPMSVRHADGRVETMALTKENLSRLLGQGPTPTTNSVPKPAPRAAIARPAQPLKPALRAAGPGLPESRPVRQPEVDAPRATFGKR